MQKRKFLYLSYFLYVCLIACFSTVFFVAYTHKANSHFNHFQPRILHIEADGADLNLYLRMPLPLLLLPDQWKGFDKGGDIPFAKKEMSKKGAVYFFDKQKFIDDQQSFIQRILDEHSVSVADEQARILKVDKIRVFTEHKRKPFSSLDYAKARFEGPPVVVQEGKLDFFNLVVDIRFKVLSVDINEPIAIKSDLGSNLKVTDRLVNIVQLYRHVDPKTITSIGVLDVTYEKKNSFLKQAYSQLKSGAWHILFGLDHILFVLLIVLAASGWLAVLRNATGFTIGHSITLTLGVLGYAPQADWFIPLVEILIAATIVYGAINLLLKQGVDFGFKTVFFIGLVHGYGFSFILTEVLKEGGAVQLPNIFMFNIGIEIGQLLIYLGFISLIFLIDKFFNQYSLYFKKGIAVIACVIACYWVIDRSIYFF